MVRDALELNPDSMPQMSGAIQEHASRLQESSNHVRWIRSRMDSRGWEGRAGSASHYLERAANQLRDNANDLGRLNGMLRVRIQYLSTLVAPAHRTHRIVYKATAPVRPVRRYQVVAQPKIVRKRISRLDIFWLQLSGISLSLGQAIPLYQALIRIIMDTLEGSKQDKNISKEKPSYVKKNGSTQHPAGSKTDTPKPAGSLPANTTQGGYSDVVKEGSQYVGKVPCPWVAYKEDGTIEMTYCLRFVSQMYSRAFPGKKMSTHGTAIEAANAWMTHPGTAAETDWDRIPPGTLLFFKADDSNYNCGHVGIYLGNGKMLSVWGNTVHEDNVKDSPYWSKLYIGWGEPQE